MVHLYINDQKGLQYPRTWKSWFVLLAGLFAALFPALTRAQDQQPNAALCFIVADGYVRENGTKSSDDTLAFVNRKTGETQPVGNTFGNTGTKRIEAIAFDPTGTQLYAVDGDRLGILDLNSGAFTPVSEHPIGVGQGQQNGTPELETQIFDDIDSLSFNPITGELWGVNRSDGPDELLKIDPTTGVYIPKTFADPFNPGQFVDFVEVQPLDRMDNVDDIAIDPVTGTIYAVMNKAGGDSALVIVNPENGSITLVGFISREAINPIIKDVEGLSFTNDGLLFGSTGNAEKVDNTHNKLWQIDKNTATATLIGEFAARLDDVEALGCLSSQLGSIALEKSTNGVDADQADRAVILSVGDAVTWTYLVRNTGDLDLFNVIVSDDSGTPDDTSDDFVVCQNFNLPAGQSNEDLGTICQATGTAVQGQYGNWASVTALDSANNQYTDSDASHYVAYAGTAVGNRVWKDIVANGVQDAFEIDQGVDGVTVNLYSATADDSTPVATTTTKRGGFYLFDNLLPGDYFLEFILPDGFISFTEPNKGNDHLDSDADPNTGRTEIFILVDGEIADHWDAGLIAPIQSSSLGGGVWHDLNGDGIQNDGALEAVGVAGATVTLLASDGSSAFVEGGVTTTDEHGSFKFTDLQPNDYRLRFSLSAAYFSFTLQNKGDSEDLDSDAHPVTGQTALVDLKPGLHAQVHAGVVKPVSIGDRVWNDINRDGVQNNNEPGVGEVVVILYHAGNVISTTKTLNDGTYLFTSDNSGRLLIPGAYALEYSALPHGFEFTGQHAGNDNAQDSDVDPGTGRTVVFVVQSGSTDRTRDAGIYQSSYFIYLPMSSK